MLKYESIKIVSAHSGGMIPMMIYYDINFIDEV